MTRRSIVEYAEAVRGRYFRAGKKAKTEILNEFVATTGMHRKAVIRLVNGRGRSSRKKKRGRPRLYGHEAMAAVRLAREASDCLCSNGLQPFPPELATILKRCGELTVTRETDVRLCQMSPSTIDRLRGDGLRHARPGHPCWTHG